MNRWGGSDSGIRATRAQAEEFDEINLAYRNANIAAIKYDAIQIIDAVSGVSLLLMLPSLERRKFR